MHQFKQISEKGMGDHHHIIYTLLKFPYSKLEPKFFNNRSFKNYAEEPFLQDVKHGLGNNGVCMCVCVYCVCACLRANQMLLTLSTKVDEGLLCERYQISRSSGKPL